MMKFTLSWLREHLETEASLDEIVETLTDLGLEVEGVENPEETLGAFTIARVVEAKQHPNADKLRVCRVETWPDGADKPSKEVQVVCGAPNARTGLVGVFAKPGVYVPGTDLLLKEGEIRGEASMGMLCSERELELSDDHDGVIDLPEDAPLGARYIDYAGLNDPVIEIAITPNRPDALGVRGVARDLAARGLGRLKPLPEIHVKSAFPCPVSVALDESVTQESDDHGARCPYFIARLIRGVKNGPSPDWLQRRLQAVGAKSFNALVDVTNFFTFAYARPLHVFDANLLKGDIRVRVSESGETMIGLDDAEHGLDDATTVVCDQDGGRVVGLGGVMGGRATGCSDGTTDVLLEAAYFDPSTTAAGARRLKIESDARKRFERGVDPVFTLEAADRATAMILELCGGEASELMIAGAPPQTGRNGVDRVFGLDTERVVSLVGMSIAHRDQIDILEALGFTVESEAGSSVSVRVPPWRPDVHGEADLVEEVARIVSLTKLQAQPITRTTQGVVRPVLTPAQRRTRLARRTLAALGLAECVTYSFIDPAEAALFGGGDAARRLDNPIASDKADMRPSLLPGLLTAAARNQARGEADVALFELGPEFTGGEAGEQRDVAVALRVGAYHPRDWSGPRRAVDLYDAKADAERLLAALGAPVEKLLIDRKVSPWMHPGRAARLKLGPKVVLAEFGELHPKILAKLGVKNAAVAATIAIEAIPEPKGGAKTRPALTLYDLQPVDRDFAFVVDATVEASDVLRAVKKADKALIAGARLFDVFEGARAEEQLGAGKKSLAIGVTLQPKKKTLTDKEIDAVAAKVVREVEKAVGGVLRG